MPSNLYAESESVASLSSSFSLLFVIVCSLQIYKAARSRPICAATRHGDEFLIHLDRTINFLGKPECGRVAHQPSHKEHAEAYDGHITEVDEICHGQICLGTEET